MKRPSATSETSVCSPIRTCAASVLRPSTGGCDAQECRRNRRGVFGLAPVLALEERVGLLLKIRRLAVLFRGGKRIYCGAVVVSELGDKRRGRAGRLKGVSVPGE